MLRVAPHHVADAERPLGLHARVGDVLGEGLADGGDAVGRRDRLAVGRHAQAHVAQRRHGVGLHARVVGVQEHRLDDGHVAVTLDDGDLAVVVARDGGEEEAGLLGDARVHHVVRQLLDRQRQRVHVGELRADLVGDGEPREGGHQLSEGGGGVLADAALGGVEEEGQHPQLHGRLRVLQALGRLRPQVVRQRARAQRAARGEEGGRILRKELEGGDDELEELGGGDKLLAVVLVHEHRRAHRLEARAHHAGVLGVPPQDGSERRHAALPQGLTPLGVEQDDGEGLEDGGERGRDLEDCQRRRHQRVRRAVERHQRQLLLVLLARGAERGRLLRHLDRVIGRELHEHHLHDAAAVVDLEGLLLGLLGLLRRLERRLDVAQRDHRRRIVGRLGARHPLHNVGQVDALRLELGDGVGEGLFRGHVEGLHVLLHRLVEGLLRDPRVQLRQLLLILVVGAGDGTEAHGALAGCEQGKGGEARAWRVSGRAGRARRAAAGLALCDRRALSAVRSPPFLRWLWNRTVGSIGFAVQTWRGGAAVP